MNRIINGFLNFFKDHPIVAVIIVIVLIAFALGGFSWALSRKYDKERLKYEADSKVREARMSQLEGENAAMRKQIAELEPKALAYIAIVDSKIKVDEGLKDKIEKVTEDAANAESNAGNTVPCRERADRLCALFRASDRNFNCNIIYAECP